MFRNPIVLEGMKLAQNQGLLFVVAFLLSLNPTVVLADDTHPIKGGIQENTTLTPTNQYVPAYGAPKMVGTPMVPKHAPPPPKTPKPPQKPLKGAAIKEVPRPTPKPPAPAPVTAPLKEGVLPAQFLGRWQVMGSRSKVEAQPQFQQGIDGIFSATTTNVWNIQGSPEQGYILSTDSGVSTGLMVQSNGEQAILRYQHPIKNTVAQEALVMQLNPGGVQFDGLERITILKQGEPPRAKVTYKLIGHRQ
jgi:hypothetical protein